MTLAHDTITNGASAPAHWLYVLHGIYGAGRNWASVMRRVTRTRPEWGVVLVDLREHGGSSGFPPPHTVAAAAADVEALAVETGRMPAAVLGHSFGGKVALVFAENASPAVRATLAQLWIVDSTPAARAPGGSAWTMLEEVRRLPAEFTSRDAAIDALVEGGLPKPTAQWMATNLESRDGVYRWRIDFDAMEELLHSFFETDAWHVVEHPEGLEVHIIKAEESSVLSGETEQRVRRAVESQQGTRLHVVAGGHWVNAENPAAIEALLNEHLAARQLPGNPSVE